MPITISGSGTVSGASEGIGPNSGTAVSASSAEVPFTGIPSWAKRITVVLADVSTSGTSRVQIQLGTSTGYLTTGYTTTYGGFNASTQTSNPATSGFLIEGTSATDSRTVIATFVLISGTTWVGTLHGKTNSTDLAIAGGSIALGATLDRIRITAVNGTDTFDSGTVNILYE